MDTLIVGEASPERRKAAIRAADRGGCSAIVVGTVAEARHALEDHAPQAIFIDHQQDIASFVAWVRGQAHLFTVPVIVTVPAADETRFHIAHCAGADDAIVNTDLGAITRRLANLSEFDPARRPEVTQGECLIASANEGRRRVLGRIARQAGFDVVFALDVDELEARASKVALIVAESDLSTDRPDKDFAWVREKENVPAIILAPEAEVPSLQTRLSAHRCSVGAINEPPDHLLFQANELLRPDVSNIRASTRVLHGAICTFRPAGSLEPAFALTYNWSREGLYVRTLDPPSRGQDLWLEVRLPFRREAAHLRGKVVWATGPHRPGGTTPPGFGLKIQAADSPPGDLAQYRMAYEELVAGSTELLQVA